MADSRVGAETDLTSHISHPTSQIPYGRQWIDDEDVRAVVDVLTGDFLTTGPKVEEFEKSLCAYTGARYASAVNSGTSALHAAYFAAGLKAGDEIITSPLTFAATANAALYLGARVRFVDVDPDTGMIDPAAVKSSLSEKIKLIVPIDFAGHPADYDAISAVASNVKVVADAAHSLGATYKGRKVGTLCDATALSMHPVKPITTAEGGAVLTSNPEFAAKAATFRTHGITRDPCLIMNNEGPWWYEQHDLGFNYRLTDLQCALGIAQMRRLQSFIDRRRSIAFRYSESLADCGLSLPKQASDVESGWHLYVVRVPDASRRKAFFEKLRDLGLGVQVHYIPVYWHPYYQFLGYQRGLCPNAENFYARCVSLPIYPKMTDDDVDSSVERVLQAVKDVL
jgi:perosamine synthetase